MKLRVIGLGVLWAALNSGVLAPLAMGQAATASSPADDSTFTGTVVSASANTMVVHNDAGVYMIFVFDRYTAKPKQVLPGSTVKVLSTPSSEPGVRSATDVIVTAEPSAASTTQTKDMAPVPVSVRRLESDLERQSKKFGLGFRAGATLDPELILLGVHAKMGPFFNRNLSFRPNVEFLFGEVTKQFDINLEAVYRLPFTSRTNSWSAYFGGGPSLGFSHRNFTEAAAGDNGIDFGQFDFKSGLNILTGLEFRSGLFLEAKTTVWASPHLRLMIGYTF